MLILGALQIAAIGLMFSSWCRTTVGAFLASYIGLLVFYFLPALGYLITEEWLDLDILDSLPPNEDDWLFGHIPMYWMVETIESGRARGPLDLPALALRTVRAATLILSFLLLARFFFLRRAFGRPANPLRMAFIFLDGFWEKINRLVGNIRLGRIKETLPESEPVFWRETAKRSLANRLYLVRLTLLFLLIVVPIAAAIAASERRYHRADIYGFTLLIGPVWALATLVLVVKSADAVPAERSNQTLHVLLTTPMSAQEIIRQKMRAIRRLQLALAAPLLSVAALEARFEFAHSNETTLEAVKWLGMYLLAIVTLFWMLSWLGMWIGAMVKSRVRTAMVGLSTLIVWCVGPNILGILVASMGPANENRSKILTLLSPATMVLSLEVRDVFEWYKVPRIAIIAPTMLLCLLLGLFLRRRCLEQADRYLRGSAVVARAR